MWFPGCKRDDDGMRICVRARLCCVVKAQTAANRTRMRVGLATATASRTDRDGEICNAPLSYDNLQMTRMVERYAQPH